ncbi:hypothetical protein ABZ635_07645 [Nocardiopsis sp. NPDC007018]|uniref:hypothetical protein n=1 Tax=Nocardiopsis sp. NPDC007018 TaxID=3155721 RepID=UPI0033D2F506
MTDNGGGAPGDRAPQADADSWFKPSEVRYRTQSEYQDPLEDDAAAHPGERSEEDGPSGGAVFPDSGGYAGLSASRPAMVEPYPDALGAPAPDSGYVPGAISYPGAGTSAYEPVTRVPGDDPLSGREPDAPSGGFPGIAASADVPLPPEEPAEDAHGGWGSGTRDSWEPVTSGDSASDRASATAWGGSPDPVAESSARDPGAGRDPLAARDPWSSQETPWSEAPSDASPGPVSDPAPWEPRVADDRDPLDASREAWNPGPSAQGAGEAPWTPRDSGSDPAPWDSTGVGDSDTGYVRTPDPALDQPLPTGSFGGTEEPRHTDASGPGRDPWTPEADTSDSWSPTGAGEELWKPEPGGEPSGEWNGTEGLDSWSPSTDSTDTWQGGAAEPWAEQTERPWSDHARTPHRDGDRYDDELSPRPVEETTYRTGDRYGDELSPSADRYGDELSGGRYGDELSPSADRYGDELSPSTDGYGDELSGGRYGDEFSPSADQYGGGVVPPSNDGYGDELSGGRFGDEPSAAPDQGGSGNTWAFDRDDPRLPDVVRDAERRRRDSSSPEPAHTDWGVASEGEPDTGTLSAAVPGSDDPLAAIADMQTRARSRESREEVDQPWDAASTEGDDSWRGGEGATQMFTAPSFDRTPAPSDDRYGDDPFREEGYADDRYDDPSADPDDRYDDGYPGDVGGDDPREEGEVGSDRRERDAEPEYEDDFTPADYGMPERPKPAKRRRDRIAEDFPGFDEAREDGDYPGYDSVDFLADTEPGATTTLWLGIASLIPGLGVITAILALFVTGPKAKRAIRESRGTLDGLGLITTGTVFAVIGILVTVISVAIWFVL